MASLTDLTLTALTAAMDKKEASAVEDAEAIILRARVAAGWIDAADLAQPEPDDDAPEADAEDLGDESN